MTIDGKSRMIRGVGSILGQQIAIGRMVDRKRERESMRRIKKARMLRAGVDIDDPQAVSDWTVYQRVTNWALVDRCRDLLRQRRKLVPLPVAPKPDSLPKIDPLSKRYLSTREEVEATQRELAQRNMHTLAHP